MPYIKQEDRGAVRPASKRPAETAGELNYQLTMLVIGYIEQHGLSYTHINDALGALDGASKEFYRCVAVPYENKKRIENGSVYPAWLSS